MQQKEDAKEHAEELRAHLAAGLVVHFCWFFGFGFLIFSTCSGIWCFAFDVIRWLSYVHYYHIVHIIIPCVLKLD